MRYARSDLSNELREYETNYKEYTLYISPYSYTFYILVRGMMKDDDD